MAVKIERCFECGQGSSTPICSDCDSIIRLKRKLEVEWRKREGSIRKLFDLAKHDGTVARYVKLWMEGDFKSIEEMLCELVHNLATEKVIFLKRATDALRVSPITTIEIESFPGKSTGD